MKPAQSLSASYLLSSLLALSSLLSASAVVIEPDLPQRSINFDPEDFVRGAFELPPDDPFIKDVRTDPLLPEQVTM